MTNTTKTTTRQFVEQLLDLGVDPNIQDTQGFTREHDIVSVDHAVGNKNTLKNKGFSL